jgi:hypothetical protein
MSKDIESMVICSHIVSDFNDHIINYGDSHLQVEFVHAFIYEILGKSEYKYFYGENFIQGKYEKYNNNSGWKTQ